MCGGLYDLNDLLKLLTLFMQLSLKVERFVSKSKSAGKKTEFDMK